MEPPSASERADAMVLTIATLLTSGPHWSKASPAALRSAARHIRGHSGDDDSALSNRVAAAFEAAAEGR